MSNLIYVATTSLDGYTEDRQGKFDWGAPGKEVSGFINDFLPSIGTYLFGRRMYETMVYWETADAEPDQPAVATEFARLWKLTDKIVYSKTLEAVSSVRTRIERDFDAQAVRLLKSKADRDICIGGAELAGEAIGAGLVDEVRLFVIPIILGGGKRCFPNDVRVPLELIQQRSFYSGAVYLRYHIAQRSR